MVKLTTQSKVNRICMGKSALPSGAICFLKNEKTPDNGRYQTPRKKGSLRKLFGGRGKNKYCLEIFDFCKNGYNSVESVVFLAWSNFNSFSNFGPLMTNDATLES